MLVKHHRKPRGSTECLQACQCVGRSLRAYISPPVVQITPTVVRTVLTRPLFGPLESPPAPPHGATLEYSQRLFHSLFGVESERRAFREIYRTQVTLFRNAYTVGAPRKSMGCVQYTSPKVRCAPSTPIKGRRTCCGFVHASPCNKVENILRGHEAINSDSILDKKWGIPARTSTRDKNAYPVMLMRSA